MAEGGRRARNRHAWPIDAGKENRITNIFVTGGAGFIGSHTAKALAGAGFTPVAFDNLERGHERAVKMGTARQRRPSRRRRAGRSVQPLRAGRSGAFRGLRLCRRIGHRYYRNNVGGTLSLLEAMKRADCGRIVFSSTCATYGLTDKVPITKDTLQNPVNPYGASKLMIECVLADAGLAHGLRSVTLRYFNAAGSDPDGEIGEEHDPETHLIPLVLEAAAGGRPLEIFCGDYATPDGSCIRDYIHVSDLVDAIVLTVRWLIGGGASRVYNLGNGRGYSVFDVLRAPERVTVRPVPHAVFPRRPGDPPVLVADARRAVEELAWKPRFGSLEDQIAHAWRFMQAARDYAEPLGI